MTDRYLMEEYARITGERAAVSDQLRFSA